MTSPHNIETDATMRVGRLVLVGRDRYRVECATCLWSAKAVATGGYRRAAEFVRSDGWTERHGIWTCPECGGADNEQHAG